MSHTCGVPGTPPPPPQARPPPGRFSGSVPRAACAAVGAAAAKGLGRSSPPSPSAQRAPNCPVYAVSTLPTTTRPPLRQVQVLPSALDSGRLQAMYYRDRALFDSSPGPSLSDRQLLAPGGLHVKPYPYRLHSVTPPVAMVSVAANKTCTGMSQEVFEFNRDQMRELCNASACSRDF